MSTSLHIVGSPGGYRLIERDWPGGHRPDYNHIRRLSDAEAWAAWRGGVSLLFGGTIAEPKAIEKPRFRVQAGSRDSSTGANTA